MPTLRRILEVRTQSLYYVIYIYLYLIEIYIFTKKSHLSFSLFLTLLKQFFVLYVIMMRLHYMYFLHWLMQECTSTRRET
jgi:hypothetical protein